MVISLVDNVSAYLGFSPATVIEIADRAPKTYKRYRIPKKSGGQRTILHPARETKALQYALMGILIEGIPVHDNAVAYEKGRSSPLRTNAELHAKYRYSIRVDLRNFFPSIGPDSLLSALESRGLSISASDSEFLTKALFYPNVKGDYGLAIGAPSSPMISNRVMYSIDCELSAYSLGRSGAYTRYADDMVYSTNVRGDCYSFLQWTRDLLINHDTPRLEINDAKTMFMSRGTRRVITGLIVSPSGYVSVGRQQKRYIRKLLCDFKNRNISASDLAYLQGYLAFILDVEPLLYNRLALKYGGSVLLDALHSRSSCFRFDSATI